MMDTNKIIELISTSKKKTPVRAYIKGNLKNIDFANVNFFGNEEFGIIFGDYKIVENILKNENIKKSEIEIIAHNSALPLANLTKYNARIEPGAIIRDMVEIGDNAVIMMGAVINIGAVIGENTMIDMNSVIGGRAIIGKNCHIGAGAVIAGVIEPPSAQPVIIEDNVVVGANAVVLEGVRICKNSVIAAGAIVTKDVPESVVVAGAPAKIIKNIDEKTKEKTKLVNDLRNLNGD